MTALKIAAERNKVKFAKQQQNSSCILEKMISFEITQLQKKSTKLFMTSPKTSPFVNPVLML